MAELVAIVKEPAQTYTRKKDNQPGLKLFLTLEDNTDITVYGTANDDLLKSSKQGEMVMVTKNGNFYNITSILNQDGEFIKVDRSINTVKTLTATDVFNQVDNEEVKKYIRWQSKILDYCYEVNPNHGDLIYQQACKRFNL